jgi:two-component system, OmpR family, sensor histidine kinase VicK
LYEQALKTEVQIGAVREDLNLSFIYDPAQETFTYFDDSILKLLGCDKKDPAPSELLDLVDEDEKQFVITGVKNLLKGIHSGSMNIRLKGVEAKSVRVTPIWLTVQGHRVLIGNVHDITDEVRNFGTIHKYANKKNSLLTLLAHDLRGTLGVAANLTGVLREQLSTTRLNTITGQIVQILKYSVDMITDLTRRELLETVEVTLLKKTINIAKKAEDYIAEYRKTEAVTQRHFLFASEPSDIFIQLDEAKIMQVFNNLMSNALKFTNNGDRITMLIKDQRETVLFKFTDNGIGIPDRLQSVLFEKNSGAGRTGLHGEPSNGIGLSLCKTIVSWHNGRIWCESEEGKGTTFFIEIPKLSNSSP